MKRIEALRAITAQTAEVPVTATCAATSRELAAVADRDNHLYLLDAMGLTVSVGTGIALGIAGSGVSRSVVLDGDGSLLMNLGSAATAGYLAQPNLVIVLLDNGVYASTAGIATQAEKLDLGAIAESVGLGVLRANTIGELDAALRRTLTEPGPWFVHTRIEAGNEPGTPLLLIDPVVHADRFRRWLTGRIAA
ncbi:thiamine pyrophosphate-dependent enzyme [Sciscionella sediminilitoris]|uniref:thiamine pyrophosphate-dependent enzyme n=1 Tax=Sciscionella sediminilitoris TaxID=1445613 RepID=UPI0004DFCBC4|nr:thiamine pyrophosphate-dependent enzyme [Sciscionella sp. SE31]